MLFQAIDETKQALEKLSNVDLTSSDVQDSRESFVDRGEALLAATGRLGTGIASFAREQIHTLNGISANQNTPAEIVSILKGIDTDTAYQVSKTNTLAEGLGKFRADTATEISTYTQKQRALASKLAGVEQNAKSLESKKDDLNRQIGETKARLAMSGFRGDTSIFMEKIIDTFNGVAGQLNETQHLLSQLNQEKEAITAALGAVNGIKAPLDALINLIQALTNATSLLSSDLAGDIRDSQAGSQSGSQGVSNLFVGTLLKKFQDLQDSMN